MVQLSMRTVIFSHAISSAICLLVMVLLWHQNRGRFAGVNLWLANSTMQFVAIVLIGLRGRIPDFASIVVGNALIVGGILVLYIGLERFVEKQSSQIYNYILLATFVLVHSYFTFVRPSMLVRNINVSLGVFLISCQATWLLLHRVTVEKRPITRWLGYTAIAFGVVNLARITFDLVTPPGNDFLSSNPYDTLIVMSSQMLFVILTFGLILTVNRRLVEELEQDIIHRKQAEEMIRASEEKYRLLFDNNPAPMWVYDAETLAFLAVNEFAIDQYGYSREEFLGMTIKDIRPPEEIPYLYSVLNTDMGPLRKMGAITHRKKDGSFIYVDISGHAIEFEGQSAMLVLALNITERLKAEEALRESETFSQAVLKNSPIGISVRSHTGRLLSANDAWKKIWAIPESAVLEDREQDRKKLEFNSRDDYLTPYQAEVRRVYEEGGYLHLPELKTLQPRPGGAEWVSQHFYALKDEMGKVDRVVILTEDISERKRTEIALSENENRLRTIFETSQAGIILVDAKGIITFANQHMADMFGCSLADLIGSTYPEHVHPDQRQIGDERMRQLIAGEIDFVALERHYIRTDGSDFWGFLSGRRHEDENGNLVSLVGIIADITERKQAEEAIQAALLDKEVLLRELYHRTKNNMQVISSMLNLEITQSDDETLVKTLKDMDNRIRSMALVHQKLYQSQNLSSIDLRDYITGLASLMLESYQANDRNINFSLQAESIPVQVDTAIPCGLIINEILSNAIKYAFPENRKGDIQINLERTKNATIVLEISDNGVGVPSDKDLRKNNTLGMQTIFGIARHQLGAEVELKTNSGVTWRIQFEDNLYTSRV